MTSSERPTVYGATYSTYVRTVLLTLEEKNVSYDLIEVDVFAAAGPPPEYLKIHPFGRIPSFEHNGFRMYEAVPIARYVDEVFSGPALQPDDVRGRALMNQIIGVLDNYGYRTLVWDIYVERSSRTTPGKIPDERRIASALPRARTCLNALADLMGEGTWMVGSTPTLADLHAAPMFDYFMRTVEGRNVATSVPPLMQWWTRVAQRPSMRATQTAHPSAIGVCGSS
jgi:glutathione S-transferase